MPQQKFLVIGWDAADWQVIEPLMAAGKMPALSKMLKEGVKGNIATLNPPLSPMLWTSIATGKRAYDHGIHGFVEVDSLTGNILPVRATTRKAKAIWNILNEAGLKTNVVNWWPSHPAEKLNGAVVTNQFHKDAPTHGEDWPLETGSVFPENLFENLKELRIHPAELTLQHVLPFIPQAASLDPEKDKVLKPLMRVLAHCASVHNAATYLMENEEWDFMAVYYEAIDHFSHLAMKYHPPQMEGVDDKEFELYHGIIEAAYRYHDMMLERLLNLAGEGCTVMLVSDHGFESGKLRQLELPDVAAAPALEHRKYGVLAAAGPSFKKNEPIFGASLLDITPTILHHFGLPVGDDMEGRVLTDIFSNPEKPGEIPSWEITGKQVEFCEEESGSSAGMLKQLEELGYINLSQKDKTTYVEQELNYNLSLSLLDGNRLEQARELTSKNYHTHGELRYGLLLARTLLRLGESENLKELLSDLTQKFPNQKAIPHFEGLLALRDGRVGEAILSFKQMESRGLISIELFLEIARALMISSQVAEAKAYFEKVLMLDSDNAVALSGRAQCNLELGYPAEALADLEKSLEQQFFQPNSHYLLAQAAHQLAFDEVAVKAVKICLQQAPKHQAAKALLIKMEKLDPKQTEAVIVVSGFPRSGTSMLMKMLRESGLSLHQDETREKDEHNPEGYFEYERVKNLGLKNDWLHEARGKVLKVVSPLLRYLPSSEIFTVIQIKRPLTEVIVSQEVMKGKRKEEVMKQFPFQMAMEMQQEEVRLENWLKMQPNMELLVVEYYDCIDNPTKVLEEITGFLKLPLDIEKGEKAINKKLHRNKLAT